MNIQDIQAYLEDPNKRVILLEEVTSTNDLIKEKAYHQIDTVLIAKSQSKGKGTQGRLFYCEKDKGIYCSFYVSTEKIQHRSTLIPLIMASAISRGLSSHGVTSQLKWVNDVLIDHKKVAGILCEKTTDDPLMVVGFGINVYEMTFPKMIEDSSTYAQKHADTSIDINKLLVDVLNEFDLITYGVSTREVIKEYSERCVDMQSRIMIKRGKKEIGGSVVGIDEDGCLLLKDRSGNIIRIISTNEIIIKNKQ